MWSGFLFSGGFMADNKRDLLDEALSRGILTAEQRKQLAELQGAEANDNDERIKPVGTMNEIFVTFGVMLLTGAIGGLIGLAVGKTAVATGILAAGVDWLVALWFHNRKRFRLPIIYCVATASISLASATFLGLLGDLDKSVFDRDVPLEVVLTMLGVALTVLAAGAARFRIPFFMLPIAVLFTIMVTIIARHGDGDTSWRLLLGGCGLTILAVAIFFDLKDPKRVTRWSDFAFWSYVVGSPLFVHSLFLSLLIQDDMKGWMNSPLLWMAMAALAIAVTFIGLLLNRRALILSTLIYISIVIFRIFASLSIGGPATLLLITTLIIGVYVTALGSRWTRIRATFMRGLPPSWTWVKRLPPY